jgi:hypothetical protein
MSSKDGLLAEFGLTIEWLNNVSRKSYFRTKTTRSQSLRSAFAMRASIPDLPLVSCLKSGHLASFAPIHVESWNPPTTRSTAGRTPQRQRDSKMAVEYCNFLGNE